jgi:hypothetical protein
MIHRHHLLLSPATAALFRGERTTTEESAYLARIGFVPESSVEGNVCVQPSGAGGVALDASVISQPTGCLTEAATWRKCRMAATWKSLIPWASPLPKIRLNLGKTSLPTVL